jgi:hypothetical protein
MINILLLDAINLPSSHYSFLVLKHPPTSLLFCQQSRDHPIDVFTSKEQGDSRSEAYLLLTFNSLTRLNSNPRSTGQHWYLPSQVSAATCDSSRMHLLFSLLEHHPRHPTAHSRTLLHTLKPRHGSTNTAKSHSWRRLNASTSSSPGLSYTEIRPKPATHTDTLPGHIFSCNTERKL